MEWLGVWLLALIIQPAELPPAVVGKGYSGGPLTAPDNVCGQQNVVWSVASGQLPPGIDLSPAGFVNGMVTAPGEWRFVVRAKSGCATIDQPFTLAAVASPLFDVRPGNIRLEAPLGRAGSEHFSIRVGSNQAGLPYTLETSGQAWLKARARDYMIPVAGRALTADLIEVDVDTTNMPPGQHKGWIRLSAWRALAPLVIPVEARILAPTPEPVAVPIQSKIESLPIPPIPVVPRPAPPPIVYTPPPPPPTHTAVPAPANPRGPLRLRRFAATRPKLSPKPPEPKPTEPAKSVPAAKGTPSPKPAAAHGDPPKPEPAKHGAAKHEPPKAAAAPAPPPKAAPAKPPEAHKTPAPADHKAAAHKADAQAKKAPSKGGEHPPVLTVKPSPVGPAKAAPPAPKPQAAAHAQPSHAGKGHGKEEKKSAPTVAHKANPTPPKDAHKPTATPVPVKPVATKH